MNIKNTNTSLSRTLPTINISMLQVHTIVHRQFTTNVPQQNAPEIIRRPNLVRSHGLLRFQIVESGREQKNSALSRARIEKSFLTGSTGVERLVEHLGVHKPAKSRLPTFIAEITVRYVLLCVSGVLFCFHLRL